MTFSERALGDELARRHGVTSRQLLRTIGLSDRQIDGLVAHERLRRAGTGVFVSTSAPATFEQRVVIACMLTGGAAAFPTAGRLWSFRKSPSVPEIHIVVPWKRRIEAPEFVRLHRSRDLVRADLVRRRDGITLTSPPRTAFEAGGFLCANDLESLIEQGLQRRNFTIPTLWAHARRLCHPCRSGSALFAEVLATRESWRRPVDSDYELRLERALVAAGFPPLVRQHPVRLNSGITVHPDLGLPEFRFFIEVDHLSWHGGRLETAYDKWRDLRVRVLGNHVERVTDLAIDHDLDETVRLLRIRLDQVRGAASTGTVA